MKNLTICLILGILIATPPLTAELCSMDAVPAATLLLPYFEVDLDNPNGATTIFSVNNAAASPTLAHVIFWTDWSYPTLSFDIYLTGYDVVAVNVRDIFEGNIPITADAPNDLQDPDSRCGTVSPCGGDWSLNPHWDDQDPNTTGNQGFPLCDQIFPFFSNPVVAGAALDRLHSGHTGQIFGTLNACLGSDHGDNIARGYITIDNASECSLAVDPADDAGTINGMGTPYFVDGGLGVANNTNQLWGNWSLIDPANAFAQGDTLVHIEAFDDLNANNLPLIHPGTGETTSTVTHGTRQTFYGRHFDDGRDNREPLGTVWTSRYMNGGSFDGSQMIIWRDSTVHEITPVPNGEPGAWCGSGPSWYPLNESEVLVFNESEDAVEICADYVGPIDPPFYEDIHCYPLTAGRYNVGDDPAGIPYQFGFMYLNLNLPQDSTPGSEAQLAQSHVTTLHNAAGQYSVGLSAVAFHNACQDFNEFVNGANVNGGVNAVSFF